MRQIGVTVQSYYQWRKEYGGMSRDQLKRDALVENDDHCRNTLILNRPKWNVLEGTQADLQFFDERPFKGIDLLAGGLPCPPFSVAGKQLGKADERNLFPDALRVVDETRPKAIMIENVRGFLGAVFADHSASGRLLNKAMAPV